MLLFFFFSRIRDTAGQERFRTITTAYYRGAMVRIRELNKCAIKNNIEIVKQLIGLVREFGIFWTIYMCGSRKGLEGSGTPPPPLPLPGKFKLLKYT